VSSRSMVTLRPPSIKASPASHASFLDELERQLEPLLRGAVLADWRLYSGRSNEGSLKWHLRRNRILSVDGLAEWAQVGRRRARDPMTARRFELLGRMATEAILEQHPSIAVPRAKLQRKIAKFRPLWHGRRTARAAVRERLRKSGDREERRAAWYAENPLYCSIEDPLRALVRLRNERARALGYRSYPEYRLSFEGFTVDLLEDLLEVAARYVRRAALEKRAEFEDATGLRDWYPWDSSYADDLTVRMPDISFTGPPMIRSVLRGVREWGFAPGPLKFRVDRHDLAFGGIEVPVDPPRDVRVVVHAMSGWTYYMILFHEVGHAVHCRSTRPHPPLLRWHEYLPGFPGFVEGVGTLFEEIPRSSGWLATRPGVNHQLAARFARIQQLSEIQSMGWLISWIRGELELYRHANGDIAQTRNRWLRRLGGFDAFDPPTFADSFYVENPVYSQSYLFATLFSKQILETMRGELGDTLWPNKRFGPWLTENWFRSSGEFDWAPHLKEITGRYFGASAFNRWARATLDDRETA
jgi:hypothetical protein